MPLVLAYLAGVGTALGAIGLPLLLACAFAKSLNTPNERH